MTTSLLEPRETLAAEPTPRLLLVDDRPENLIALEAVLEPLGADMVRANSGMEALKQLLSNDFAVILLDVQMPGMDGFETAALIKEREKSRHIPIIFITAISKEDRYIFRGYTAGAVDYLSKPIDADILRSKVTVFIDLWKKGEQIRRQAELLRQADLREAERERIESERDMERKHMAEVAEREAQLSQFKATLDATLDAVLLFDPHSLRYFYVNQGALNLLGYTEEEILAKTAMEIEVEVDAEAFGHRLGALRTGRLKVFKNETFYRHRNGSNIPVEVMTQYIAPQGGSDRFVCIVRDITDRRQTEAQLAALYAREKRIAEALQHSIVLAPAEDMFPGLAIATRYEAAWDEAGIGGDFFDTFALDGGRVALVVGDVSGKGLAAAARTAEVKYALRAFLRESSDPAQALSRLNGILCDTKRLNNLDLNNEGFGAFICLSLVVVDVASGDAVFAGAGMEPPLLLHKTDSRTIEVTGMPVGIEPGETYTSSVVKMAKGDTLLIVTDGITEARKGGDFFGYEGLVENALRSVNVGSLHQMGESILVEARQFAGGKLQDDACILLARRH